MQERWGIRLLRSAVVSHPIYGTLQARPNASPVQGIKLLSTKVLRKILKAQETLFKYGTMIPRSDREAEMSPEAVRWRSGRQLE